MEFNKEVVYCQSNLCWLTDFWSNKWFVGYQMILYWLNSKLWLHWQPIDFSVNSLFTTDWHIACWNLGNYCYWNLTEWIIDCRKITDWIYCLFNGILFNKEVIDCQSAIYLLTDLCLNRLITAVPLLKNDLSTTKRLFIDRSLTTKLFFIDWLLI